MEFTSYNINGKTMKVDNKGRFEFTQLTNTAGAGGITEVQTHGECPYTINSDITQPEVFAQEYILNGVRTIKVYSWAEDTELFAIDWGVNPIACSVENYEASGEYSEDETEGTTIVLKVASLIGHHISEPIEVPAVFYDETAQSVVTDGIVDSAFTGDVISTVFGGSKDAEGVAASKYEVHCLGSNVTMTEDIVDAGNEHEFNFGDVEEDENFYYVVWPLDADGVRGEPKMVKGLLKAVINPLVYMEDIDGLVVMENVDSDSDTTVDQEDDQGNWRKWQVFAKGMSDDFKIKINGRLQELNESRSVKNIHNAKIISHISTYHAFALFDDGTVYCCGLNSKGQLGLGDNNNRPDWTDCGLTNVAWMAVGSQASYYVTNDGDLYATGYNNYYQLGLGDNEDRNTWTQVDIPEPVDRVYAGPGYVLILNREEKKLWSTGFNGRGNGASCNAPDDNLNKKWIKAKHPFKERIDEFEVGTYHIFAKSETGRIRSVGENYYGNLSNGSVKIHKDCPWSYVTLGRDPFTGDKNPSIVKCGGWSSYQLDEKGFMFCCGDNHDCQLGEDFELDNDDERVMVPDFTSDHRTWLVNVGDIAAAYDGAIATLKDGKVYITGNNIDNRLGPGDSKIYEGWEEIDGIDADTYYPKARHTMVMTRKDGLKAIGKNDYGQLGDGSTTDRNEFVDSEIDIETLLTFVAVDNVDVNSIDIDIVEGTAEKVAIKLWIEDTNIN